MAAKLREKYAVKVYAVSVQESTASSNRFSEIYSQNIIYTAGYSLSWQTNGLHTTLMVGK